ncbi:MAG TPA: hypothetical protein VL382_05290, partial [Terriglobales bacterium]|nr:hypothetical protein [Terriglobales bacterium]
MRNKTILTLALVAALVPAAFAGRKEDLERQAQQAAQQRKLDEAAAAYCELARIDAARKSDCDAAKQEAAAENRRNDDRFSKGVGYFNQGNMDDAEHEFRNIRFGPHYSEAQQYLSSKIPAKRAELSRPATPTPTAAPSDQTFSDAVQAYNGNNFSTAKTLFSQVRGNKAGDAQAYLSKINQYESAMSEGDRLAASGNHRQAQNSYEDAARLKADGPGNPRDKAANELRLASAPPTPSTPSPTPTPTPTYAGGGGGGTTPSTTTKPTVRAGAIKEPERPKIDTGKLLRDADAARAKGDTATAKSKYVAVLAEEPDNSAARSALQQIQQEEQAKPQEQQQAQVKVATPEADLMLARAIGEYYKGNYTDAETHIKDYLSINGSKTALSHFFLGVSKMTEYYLHGETDKK